jgi:hypothetical protein
MCVFLQQGFGGEWTIQVSLFNFLSIFGNFKKYQIIQISNESLESSSKIPAPKQIQIKHRN